VGVPRRAAAAGLATALGKITGERHMRAHIEAGKRLADALKKPRPL